MRWPNGSVLSATDLVLILLTHLIKTLTYLILDSVSVE